MYIYTVFWSVAKLNILIVQFVECVIFICWCYLLVFLFGCFVCRVSATLIFVQIVYLSCYRQRKISNLGFWHTTWVSSRLQRYWESPIVRSDKLKMSQKSNDCYFYYYSKCAKVSSSFSWWARWITIRTGAAFVAVAFLLGWVTEWSSGLWLVPKFSNLEYWPLKQKATCNVSSAAVLSIFHC